MSGGAAPLAHHHPTEVLPGTSPPPPVAQIGERRGALRALRAAVRSSDVRDRVQSGLLFVADLLAVCYGWAALRIASPGAPVWLLGALVATWVSSAQLHGLYGAHRRRTHHRTSDELTGLVHSALAGLAAAALAGGGVSPTGLVAFALIAPAAAGGMRTLARILAARALPSDRTVVLGAGELADALRRRLHLEGTRHLHVLEGTTVLEGIRAEHGDPAVMARTLQEARIERVIVADEALTEEGLEIVLEACRQTRIKLSIAPPLRAILRSHVEVNHLGDLPLADFGSWHPSRLSLVLKRALDVAVSGLAILSAAPLLAAIAAAIKLTSRGPVFYVAHRAGRGGRPFSMLKFRTMVSNADALLREVVDVDSLEDPMYKLKRDPRVTGIGRLLRRTSLDELPQLFNVLRGDMSLVGPRPEDAWLVARYDDESAVRLRVRPGMTGPMQVHGRGDLTFHERLALEREYVEHYSLARDLQILMRTATAVTTARGAY
jgi:exopolysaccharide biosynthesis polyprenyl glycosylphosphotransferase